MVLDECRKTTEELWRMSWHVVTIVLKDMCLCKSQRKSGRSN